MNIVIALILALVRIAGHKSATFQAVAHLFVGGYIGIWLTNRSRNYYLWLAIFLSTVELVCFLVFRATGL